MTFVTVYFLVGTMFAATGYAMMLARFFGSRRESTSTAGRWSPPHYAAAWAIAVIGVGLNVFGFVEMAHGETALPALFVVAGVSTAGLAALPAFMLLIAGAASAVAWASERSLPLPPWRFTVGLSLLLFSVGVGIIVPVTILILQR